MIASGPVKNSDLFRHLLPGVYASATRCGSRVFHPSSAARTLAIASSRLKGGVGGRVSMALLGGIGRRSSASAAAREGGDDLGCRGLGPKQGGTLARVDHGGVVVATPLGVCVVVERRLIGGELLLAPLPRVEELVPQSPAAVLPRPAGPLGDVEDPPVCRRRLVRAEETVPRRGGQGA